MNDGVEAIDRFKPHAANLLAMVLALDLPRRAGTACRDAMRRTCPKVTIVLIPSNAEQLPTVKTGGSQYVLAEPFST